MPVTDLRLPSTDGFELAATRLEPAGPARGTVVINSAMAVRRAYYGRFAAALAARGLRVITWDYRGMGDSRVGSVKESAATILQWGEQDLPVVLAAARAGAPEKPLVVIGHSVGGQILGLAPNNGDVDAFVAIAAQVGDWRRWDGLARWKMLAVWYGAMPAALKVLGYVPKALLGGEDLPPGVASQWMEWARRPDYVVGGPDGHRRAGYERVRAPTLGLSFADDDYAPRRAADRLLEIYANAPVTRRHVRPEELDLKAIGHFGYFREAGREKAWPLVLDWIDERIR